MKQAKLSGTEGDKQVPNNSVADKKSQVMKFNLIISSRIIFIL